MSAVARPRKPLILLSDDVQSAHWDASGESELMSRLAVCQDVWGRNCFAPGQYAAMRQAATALVIDKKKIYGAIGVNMGGFGFVTEEIGAYVEVFEYDEALAEHNAASPQFLGKLVKLERWKPGEPRLKANRYHALSTYGAFAAAGDVAGFAREVVDAVKPGGYLFVDEIWANDPVSATKLANATSLWQDALRFRFRNEVVNHLTKGLELRASSEACASIKVEIRDALSQAQVLHHKLKQIPEAVRKQRVLALSQELQRAVLLFDALDRGAVSATRLVFQKRNTI